MRGPNTSTQDKIIIAKGYQIAMKIESIEFFYLAMPEVTTAADDSQDALVVRVGAGNLVGWSECESAPLPSIAAFVAAMSHGACQPVSAAVLGQDLSDLDDINRMAADVDYLCMDLPQAVHTWSGIEMALWDVLGKSRDLPVWKLLGYTNENHTGRRRSDPCSRRARAWNRNRFDSIGAMPGGR